jgi:hypothetical protein
MKKLVLLVLVTFTFLNSDLNAQEYKSAIGLRLGVYNGITFKTHLNEKTAIELYGTARFGTGYNWFTVTGLYQFTGEIKDVDGLGWYAGGGPSVFLYGSDFAGGGFTTFGITGIAGIEYTLKETPLNFSLDWSPTFLLKSGLGFQGDYFALSVRYVLGKN